MNLQPNKVCIIGPEDSSVVEMFLNRGWESTKGFEGASLIQFTGGEDVSPILYGESKHPSTYINASRDRSEMFLWNYAVKMGIPCAGICRGGQLLNVANGGKMYQDVDNHTRSHLMSTSDGRLITVTSTHHQMMRAGTGGVVLGFAKEATRKSYMRDSFEVVHTPTEKEKDTEVVLYRATKSLCFQPHPEYLDKESDCQEYYFELIDKHLLNKRKG